jgi:hypothetical protein
MIKALKVIATTDFQIIVELEDGRSLKMDMNFLKEESGPVVDPLKKIEEFKKVFINQGIVTWPSGYDIDPYLLEEEINKTA